MAIKLVSNYAKRLGLPGYSSHQFSVSVETELTDLGQVQGEITRLYGLLQDAVDREIEHVGFVPPDTYGMESNGNGNGNGLRLPSNGSQGNGSDRWACSEKQQELIMKLVSEHDLDRNNVDELAQERFGIGVRQLNKLQASGLIEELLENHSGNGSNGKRGRKPASAGRKGGRS